MPLQRSDVRRKVWLKEMERREVEFFSASKMFRSLDHLRQAVKGSSPRLSQFSASVPREFELQS